MEPVTSTSLAGVCIVCGPPGSGKTTFVQQHMRPGDIVLDMDTIVSALTGSKSAPPDYSGIMDTALSPLNQAKPGNVLLLSPVLRTESRLMHLPSVCTATRITWTRRNRNALEESATTTPDQIKKKTVHWSSAGFRPALRPRKEPP